MEHPDDIELGERENDAFLPSSSSSDFANSSSGTTKPKAQYGFLKKYIPARILSFYYNLTKLKLVIILLVSFMILISWVRIANRNSAGSVSIPKESRELLEKVKKELNGTVIPEYVLTYAPLVYLDEEDTYYPSDLEKHVEKTSPTLNFTAIKPGDIPKNLGLDNLDKLNDIEGGLDVYLTSSKNAIKLPKFLQGKKPSSKTLQTHHARSCAIIVVEKKDDGVAVVDVFYMYFYSFNAGPVALGHAIGNHVGDWEHNAIRFRNGVPQSIWYSQHEYGQAFTYDAVQKAGSRPLAYSARGSHANYAKIGSHDLHEQGTDIPAQVVFDHTSGGVLWDPTLSAYYYNYLPSTEKFSPALKETPVNWLYFKGKWGDPEYGDEKKGQETFHGYHKWTGGPQGPWFKHLDRKDVCLPRTEGTCVIFENL